MIVGLDARPALFGHTGVGRVVRESVRALARRDDVELRLYGASWRRAEPGLELPGAVTPRLPARLQNALAPLGFGVETLLGPLDVFHHTDLVFAPVRRTPQVLNIYDLVYLQDSSWHEPGFAERVWARVRRRALGARALIVSCARVADAVIARQLAPAERVHVVPPGCDHLPLEPLPDEERRAAALLQRAGLPTDRPLVLVPGTREPRKNQLALIEAYEALDTDAILLLAGGRGWGCPELERRLQRRDGRVGTVDRIDDAELALLMRRAAVVAYPSLAEGFGLPVFEALAQGRAVLSSRDTPMADLAGEALELVDPRSGSELSAGLAKLLGDAPRRAERAAAGLEIAARFSWSSHASGLRGVYAAALS